MTFGSWLSFQIGDTQDGDNLTTLSQWICGKFYNRVNSTESELRCVKLGLRHQPFATAQKHFFLLGQICPKSNEQVLRMERAIISYWSTLLRFLGLLFRTSVLLILTWFLLDQICFLQLSRKRWWPEPQVTVTSTSVFCIKCFPPMFLTANVASIKEVSNRRSFTLQGDWWFSFQNITSAVLRLLSQESRAGAMDDFSPLLQPAVTPAPDFINFHGIYSSQKVPVPFRIFLVNHACRIVSARLMLKAMRPFLWQPLRNIQICYVLHFLLTFAPAERSNSTAFTGDRGSGTAAFRIPQWPVENYSASDACDPGDLF